jgi:hypothetical protein
MTCAGKVSSEVGAPTGRPSFALLPAESRIGCTGGGGLADDGGERKLGFRSPQHRHAHIPTTYTHLSKSFKLFVVLFCCSLLFCFSSQNKTKKRIFSHQQPPHHSPILDFQQGRRRNYLQIPTLLDPSHLLTI